MSVPSKLFFLAILVFIDKFEGTVKLVKILPVGGNQFTHIYLELYFLAHFYRVAVLDPTRELLPVVLAFLVFRVFHDSTTITDNHFTGYFNVTLNIGNTN